MIPLFVDDDNNDNYDGDDHDDVDDDYNDHLISGKTLCLLW